MKYLFTLLGGFFSVAMLAQDISITNSLGTFKARWTIESKETVVVIIPGSGSVDRSGNAPGMTGNSLLYLTDSLAARGISSLSTDKMNSIESVISDSIDGDYRHFVSLASRWVDVAVDSGYTRIIVLGHSQGALTALILGHENEHVDGVISLCGAGRRIHEILKDQFSEQFPETAMVDIRSDLDSVASGEEVRSPNPLLAGMFTNDNQRFLHSWIREDPCYHISQIDKPVLIIGGENDIQVPVSEAELLAGCNPDAEKVIITGMGHMLKKAPGVRILALNYYGKPEIPLHPELAGVIAGFARRR